MTTNVSISRSTWLVRCPACKKPQKIHASHCYACGSRLESPGNRVVGATRTSSSGGRSVSSRPGGQGARSRTSRPSSISRGSTGAASGRRTSGTGRGNVSGISRGSAAGREVSPRLALSAVDLSTVPTRPNPMLKRTSSATSRTPVDWSAIPTLPEQTIETGQGSRKPVPLRSKRYTNLEYEHKSSIRPESQFPDKQAETPRPARTTRRLDPIEEIDTQPEREIAEEPTLILRKKQHALAAQAEEQATRRRSEIAEEPTLVLRKKQDTSSVQVEEPALPRASRRSAVEDESPAVEGGEYVLSAQPFHTLRTGPLGSMRWWLLRPGRLEFIMWISGTIFLIFLTCALILDSVFSFVTVSNGGHPGLNFNPPGNSSSSPPSSMTTLALLNRGMLSPESSLLIEGKGFSPHSKVVFFFDEAHPFLAPDGSQTRVEVDAAGHFMVTLVPGKISGWTTGKHLLVANELSSHRSAALGPLLVGSH